MKGKVVKNKYISKIDQSPISSDDVYFAVDIKERDFTLILLNLMNKFIVNYFFISKIRCD